MRHAAWKLMKTMPARYDAHPEIAAIPAVRREDPDEATLRRGGVLGAEEVVGLELV